MRGLPRLVAHTGRGHVGDTKGEIIIQKRFNNRQKIERMVKILFEKENDYVISCQDKNEH